MRNLPRGYGKSSKGLLGLGVTRLAFRESCSGCSIKGAGAEAGGPHGRQAAVGLEDGGGGHKAGVGGGWKDTGSARACMERIWG